LENGVNKWRIFQHHQNGRFYGLEFAVEQGFEQGSPATGGVHGIGRWENPLPKIKDASKS